RRRARRPEPPRQAKATDGSQQANVDSRQASDSYFEELHLFLSTPSLRFPISPFAGIHAHKRKIVSGGGPAASGDRWSPVRVVTRTTSGSVGSATFPDHDRLKPDRHQATGGGQQGWTTP